MPHFKVEPDGFSFAPARVTMSLSVKPLDETTWQDFAALGGGKGQ